MEPSLIMLQQRIHLRRPKVAKSRLMVYASDAKESEPSTVNRNLTIPSKIAYHWYDHHHQRTMRDRKDVGGVGVKQPLYEFGDA